MPSLKTDSSNSRLAAWCEGLIEATWLAAVSVVPLLINPHAIEASSEPFQFGLLRCLALFGFAAASVRLLERSRAGYSGRALARRFAKLRLAWAMGLLGAALILSTAFSISPITSFWGAEDTSHGVLTWVAGMVFCGLIACHLRTRAQADRLVTVLLAASFAVSLFALLQRADFDPRHPELKGARIVATLGHAIYLAGYLMMVIPLAIWRLLTAATRAGDSAVIRALRVALYAIIVAAQLAAFFCAESRGPALALAAALLAFAVFYTYHQHWRRLRWVTVTAMILLFAASIASHGDLRTLSKVPGLKRFGMGEAEGDSYRLGLWRMAPVVMLDPTPFPYPSGGSDRWHSLRRWLGFGPDTLQHVLAHYFTPGAGRFLENRFHNLVYDQWFNLGFFGLGALLLFFICVFFQGFRFFGLISSGFAAALFFITLALSAAGSSILFVRLVSPAYAGLGLLCGLAGGVILFAALSPLPTPSNAMRREPKSEIRLLVAALMAALVGHLVDMGFVFLTSPTALLLWIYLGLIAALCRGLADPASLATVCPELPRLASENNYSAGRPAADLQSVTASAALVSMGVVTLLFSVIQGFFIHPFTVSALLQYALLNLNPGHGGGRVSLMILPVAGFWVAAALGLALDAPADRSSRKFPAAFVWPLALSGAAGLGYAWVKGAQLAGMGPIQNTDILTVLAQARGFPTLYFGCAGSVLLLILFAAWGLAVIPQGRQIASRGGILAASVAALVAGAGIWVAGLQPLQASLCGEWGVYFDRTGHPQLACSVYRLAATLDQRSITYPLALARALLAQAEREPDPHRSRALLAEAEQVLMRTRTRSELSRAAFYLGQVYFRLAWLEEPGPGRNQLARKASIAFDQDLVFEPGTHSSLIESALLDQLLLDRPAQALAKLRKAKQLARPDLLTWADAYAFRSTSTSNPALSHGYSTVAVDYYDAIIQSTNATPADVAKAQFHKGRTLLNGDDVPSAIQCFKVASLHADQEDLWQVETILAGFCIKQKDLPEAKRRLERAIAAAPLEERAALSQALKQLGPP